MIQMASLALSVSTYDRYELFFFNDLAWMIVWTKTTFVLKKLRISFRSFQGSIYDWVQYHRLHHRTFKTADDPYCSEKDFLHAQVFAHIRSLSPKQEYMLKQIDMKDLESDKIVMFQKKYAPFWKKKHIWKKKKHIWKKWIWLMI